MAEDSYIQQIVSTLTGRPTSGFKEQVNLAPPLPAYPSDQDADYARNYGFADNSVNEDYLNNNKARVLGQWQPLPQKGKSSSRAEQFHPQSGAQMHTASDLFDPERSADFDLNAAPNSGLQGDLRNLTMRAGLAANRSPIAAVGFDPSKVVIDTLMQHGTVGGLYRPSADTIYSTMRPTDSIVHESTHRGIQKLREAYPEETKAIMGHLPDEEMVVRHLMQSKGGDPEGHDGPKDAEQRQEAIRLFSPQFFGDLYKPQLGKLEELAIEAMKNRGKRAGPQ